MESRVPIERIDVSAYRIPTDAPEADGTLAWDQTGMVLVEASAQGVTGIGWTYGDPAGAAVAGGKLADTVTGRNAMDVGGSFEAMVRAVRNDGRPGMVSMAISAIDTALWDLKARLLDLPLCHLLGAVRAEVPVYGSGGFTTYDENQLTEQLLRWVNEQALPRVKIKIGESWGTRVDRDLRRIERTREVIGDEVELYVDANGAYSRKQAIRVADATLDLGVLWYEEPVSSDHLQGLSQVRHAVTPDVAAGEYGYDLFYFKRMFDAEAVDCAQIDVTRCGGITEWRRIAALAHSYGLDVSGHCAPALHVHVAAATHNFRHLEWFHDHERIEAMFFDGVHDPAGGSVRPVEAEAAGNGLSFRRADAQPYRVS